MHQSLEKQLPRRRDPLDEFDAIEEGGKRAAYRAAMPKARKFPWREEPPRAERTERDDPQD